MRAGKRERNDKNLYARAISINRAGDEFVCACRTCDEIRNRKNVRKREKIKLEPIAIVFLSECNLFEKLGGENLINPLEFFLKIKFILRYFFKILSSLRIIFNLNFKN